MASYPSCLCHQRENKMAHDNHLVNVKNRTESRYTVDIKSDTHHIVGDEPIALGGENLGMNPYQLLLGALGACTVMTIKMYAERKSIKLSKIEVILSHEKKYYDHCQSCEEQTQKLDTIDKEILIEGDITPQQHQRILEIAEKCPVNRTLQSEIIINSKKR